MLTIQKPGQRTSIFFYEIVLRGIFTHFQIPIDTRSRKNRKQKFAVRRPVECAAKLREKLRSISVIRSI